LLPPFLEAAEVVATPSSKPLPLRLLGLALLVLQRLSIWLWRVEVGVVVDWAVAVVPVGLELALLCRLAQVQSTR
jgi:hypothetical protein